MHATHFAKMDPTAEAYGCTRVYAQWFKFFENPWAIVHQAALPMQNTGVSCHFLLQVIFLTQGMNLHFLYLLHQQEDSLPLHHLGSHGCMSKLTMGSCLSF